MLNANFRLGTAENAAAVARFAARAGAPEAMRIEALEMLAAWAKPSGHDRVLNAWRPLKPRDAALAAAALRPALGGIFAGSNHLRQVAAKVAGQLGIKEVVPVLLAMAADTSKPAEVRVQAMAAIEQLHDARVNSIVSSGLADSEPAVRSEARRILAIAPPGRRGSSARASARRRHARRAAIGSGNARDDQISAGRKNPRGVVRQNAGRPGAARVAA